MATVNITFISVCDGGDHLQIGVQVGLGQTRTFSYTVDELRGAIPLEDIRNAALLLMRLHCGGMTKAQARTELQAGIQVVTS
jgi:hypothetical protein